MTRLCLCGCGRTVTGQRSKKFYSDACRKRFDRGSAPRQDASLASSVDRESRTNTQIAPGISAVRELDREVHCSGCWSLMPKLSGPLPVPAFCRDCAP